MWKKCALGGGLLLVFATGFFNPGIIGIDDYNHGFATLIPAQTSPPWSELVQSGIHPVLPKIFLSLLSQGVLKLGVTDPFWQLSFCLSLIGLGVFLLCFRAFKVLFQDLEQRQVGCGLLAFYFAMPLFSTRPMIETLSMPFLTLSAAWAARFNSSGTGKSLFLALLFLCIASLLRFQAGVCGFALLLLALSKRNPAQLVQFVLLSLGLFILTGLPDVLTQGRFHGQLRSYIDYNLQFSGEHFGRMPFYTFFALALGLTLPPTFFSRYRGLDWRREFAPLLAPLLYVAFFLVAHSLSPHKEDRFIVPILPLILACLVPLLLYLWRKRAFVRLGYFALLNTFLLVLTCTNIAQNNVIGLARWLGQHPSIRAVDALEGALVFHPQAFLLRTIQWNDAAISSYSNSDCSRLTVVRSDLSLPPDWAERFKPFASFPPGWTEQILVRANKKNARRGPLLGFLPLQCPPTANGA